jgi:CRP-like cAMP-binding protein
MRLTRSLAASSIAWLSAAILTVALIRQYVWLGGPYWVFPETVQDHVWPTTFASRDVIVLARHAARIVPRNATVTAIEPSLAPNYDVTHFLTAAGMMPHHRVVPPRLDGDRAALPEYVLAVRGDFSDERYRLVYSGPDGKIYEVIR